MQSDDDYPLHPVPKAPAPLDPTVPPPEGLEKLFKEYGATLSQLKKLMDYCENVLSSMRDIPKGPLKREFMAVPKRDLALLVQVAVETDNLIKLHLTPEPTNNQTS